MTLNSDPGARTAAPVPITRNAPSTFYRGAGRIDRFRGGSPEPTDRPEDWIASTVTRFGDESAGLTILGTGRSLRAEVRADPATWVGDTRSDRPELGVPLVKLLDAGQRLPVHVHPDDADACRLGVGPQGKAEAWFLLEVPADGVVHVGWSREVDASELAGWVERQDVAAMLDALHPIDVAAGDTVYVPPGTPHAIGAGIFLVEVQQAADLSVLLEWEGFFPDSDGAFLGLSTEAALGCVELAETTTADVQALVTRGALDCPAGSRLLPVASEQYFSADLLGDGSVVPAQYRTLVVLAGAGRLVPGTGTGGADADADADAVTDLGAGQTFAVPAGAGPLRVVGSADLRVLAFGVPAA